MRYLCIILITAFATINIISCVCLDCDPIDIPYTYINMSSYDVELKVQVYSGTGIAFLDETIIRQNDSLTIVYHMVDYEDFAFDEELNVSFRFLSEPEKCLTFSGGIVDSLDDPRSRMALDPVHGDYYTIDDSLYAKADTCQ